MSQKLITALFDEWVGKPILVIGGGPSANVDLPRLVEWGITPACVISANEHGGKQNFFPVTLGINMDKRHCLLKKDMREVMAPLGVPIANPHSWADYRLPDWPFRHNTGLAAVLLAAALGGNPVLATGMDCWSTGRVYFHDAPSRKRTRPSKSSAHILGPRGRRLRELVEHVRGANVYPLSGPMCSAFSKFDPDARHAPPQPTKYRKHCLKITPLLVECVHQFPFSTYDMVNVGRILALSPKEYDKYRCKVQICK